MSDPAFNQDELEIIEHINAAMRGIISLGLRMDTKNLEVELCAHVHGLQMFVAKHAMERIGFAGITQWFLYDDQQEGGDDTMDPRTDSEKMEDTRPEGRGFIDDETMDAEALEQIEASSDKSAEDCE